ncbi:MAG: nucleotide exchange factor GrpE [Parcubacteria group bacterium]
MSKHEHQEEQNKELSELRAKCEEYLAGWKRALADYQNLVKATAKNQCEYVKFANCNLILELLPVLNNFKLALKQVPAQEKDSAWIKGLVHIKSQLEESLKSNGVEEIKTVGVPFDALEHEAVEKFNDEATPENVIVEEKCPGYKLNGKVVCAAKVVVNAKDAKPAFVMPSVRQANNEKE